MEWEDKKGGDTKFWSEEGQMKVTAATIRRIRMIENENLIEVLTGGDDNCRVRSTQVPEDLLHAVEEPLVIVGADVEQLYPSMSKKQVAKLMEEAVINSSIKWVDLDYLEGCRLIALNKDEDWCRGSKLSRVLPRRRVKAGRKKAGGRKPKVTGRGPMGPLTGDQEQWEFPQVTLTEEEKKLVLATIVSIMVDLLFSTHLYTFGGATFLQKDGGPIGLRGTCAIARVIMCLWDDKWLDLLGRWRVNVKEYVRYMDDGRTFLTPLRNGWRWTEGELLFSKKWREEDKDLSPSEVTKRVLHGTMQEVMDFLKFTTEVGEDFGDGWLPTLDLSLAVDKDTSLVKWRFYEKPTCSQKTVQKRSAMGETTKAQILSNDMVRRLLLTGEDLPEEERIRVVDEYSLKLLRSGHREEKVREIVLAGIRGFERRLLRSKLGKRKLYRRATESLASRQTKKIIGATDWYRKRKAKPEEDDEDQSPSKKRKTAPRGGSARPKEEERDAEDLPTRSVIFVEYSEGGELLRRVKEVLKRMERIVGCKIRAVEKTGTPLS